MSTQDTNHAALEQFRAETRAWLEDNCPQSMRTPMADDEWVMGGRHATFKNPESKLWLQRMGGKGWTAPTWPTEYGGGGLDKAQAKVLAEELKHINARTPLVSFGLWMIGPVLLEYGTEEQKREHLPPIVKGDIWWCQGYSEPAYGSDLAGLQTRAEDKGDHFVVNGQKVWTSYADKADWIYALVRTNTDEKHGGITMLIFDMNTPGVSTSPIKLISGSSPFCETFFDDVQVPKSGVVGKVNGGWEVSNRLLQFERENVSADVFAAEAPVDLGDVSKRYLGEQGGAIADPVMRNKLANLKIREQGLHLTIKRIMEQAKAGQSTGATSSIIKFLGAELNKDRFEYFIEVMGQQGLGWEGDGFSDEELDTCREWLRSKGNSIEGGTTEINLNVVAKRVLGLK